MKTILFLAVIALYCLSSCEKNYSCLCTEKYNIPNTEPFENDYIAWSKNTTKNKAKHDCDTLDNDGLPSGWVTIDCGIYVKK